MEHPRHARAQGGGANGERQPAALRVAILGAGVAGICMGIKLKQANISSFTIYEKASHLGGTWRDNTYPGAGCDVPSHLYCFSFEPNMDWSRKFAEQPEIQGYLERCAAKYDLFSHIRFNTPIESARFDEEQGLWRLRTSEGEEITAHVLITASGQLNRPYTPPIAGLEIFEGVTFHSARWDHTHDLSGEAVAVIGNGPSAVQFIPRIAPIAGKLYAFQRTPNWIVPRLDRPYRMWEKWAFERVPLAARLYRELLYWDLERRFFGLLLGTRLNEQFAKLSLGYMHSQVTDPHLREALTPRYPLGCKRIIISDDYYPALQRPNVEVVTSPIERVTRDSVITCDGEAREVKTLIFATGFETTSFLAPVRIEGLSSRKLEDEWRGGAEAYLGVTIPGFPNLFMLYGPNTNLGHNSIIFMIECQARYILQCMRELEERDLIYLDVKRDAMQRYNEELQRELSKVAWSGGCNSWYKTAEGKVTNNWSGSTVTYWWRTRRPDLAAFHRRARSAGGSRAGGQGDSITG